MPAYVLEQERVTVSNDDTAVNTEIAARIADGWAFQQAIISGTDMILFFSRQVEVEAP